ncbi:MAG: hypothetical protein JJU11_00535 [Candidatus Sumerlaeia bacterium]|nr:hypothetical protein [Candidatus Sumerlaeia bacterium]
MKERSEFWWPVLAAFVFVALFFLLRGQSPWFYLFEGGQALRPDRNNVSYMEAARWMSGHLTLTDGITSDPLERHHDSAYHNGASYNIFQPGQTLFFAATFLIWNPERGIPIFKFLILALGIGIAGIYAAVFFRGSGRRWLPAALLLVTCFVGAPFAPNFDRALNGSVYRVNHVFVWFFIGLFLLQLTRPPTERRLLLLGGISAAAILFRLQSVLILLLPTLMLLQNREGTTWEIRRRLTDPGERKSLLRQLFLLGILPLLAVVAIHALNFLKFGNPLETGYMKIYEERDDYLAARAHDHGLMSPCFLPENIFRHFLSTPEVEFNGWIDIRVEGDDRGNGILFSLPILFTLLMLGGQVWRNARIQAVFLTMLLVSLPVLLYHNPGYYAPGYSRYSLDYLPLLFFLLALSFGCAGRWKGAAFAAIPATIWSVAYTLALG